MSPTVFVYERLAGGHKLCLTLLDIHLVYFRNHLVDLKLPLLRVQKLENADTCALLESMYVRRLQVTSDLLVILGSVLRVFWSAPQTDPSLEEVSAVTSVFSSPDVHVLSVEISGII